jgi:DtxR family transcriptional regulator, Mn-dependent transcriptional regulator
LLGGLYAGGAVPSSTVEDYLKQLYLGGQGDGGMMPTGQLATMMGVVPGTATAMMKALADSGLVEYEPRQGARLTPRGEQLALHVLRRHRLVELFLVKVLGLDWSVVHAEAEALEHAISEVVLERIDAVLGHPTDDPHGDPIPTRKGQLRETARSSLADGPLHRPQRVARILDQSPEFLKFAEQHGLMPGAQVAVVGRETAAQAIKVRVAKRRPIALGVAAAEKILVEPI